LRIVSRFINLLLYAIIAVTFFAALGSVISKQPLLITVVRSNSMFPLFERGDLVLIERITPKDTVRAGDIVVFKTEIGDYSKVGWIIHRIVDGNDQDGYITKGDNNPSTDQEMGGTPPIKKEWIVSRAITLGHYPLKVKSLGLLPLWVENLQSNPYVLPGFAILLAAVIGIVEWIRSKKKKLQRKGRLDIHTIYFISGITVSVLMYATMISASQHINVVYEVSETDQGVMDGSSVGMIRIGDEVEKPLVELNNKGFFPLFVFIVTKDPQISFSDERIALHPGQNVNTSFQVHAHKTGKYKSVVRVAIFYPIIPNELIHRLNQINYHLALAVVSIIPGLPFMIYPLLDSNMRRRILRKVRRLRRRMNEQL
jgi:signal peptidase